MRRRLRGFTPKVATPIAPASPEPGVDETGGGDDSGRPRSTPCSRLPPIVAKAAAVEAGGKTVGKHQGVEAEDDPLVVTHSFATKDPAYVGWRWAVTVTRNEDSDHVTVDEVCLLPGSAALLAPAWVPWSERVQPGDLPPATCCRRRRTTRDWCRPTPTRRPSSPPRRSGSSASAARECCRRTAAPTPRTAGTTESAGRTPRWPGRPRASASTAASGCSWPAR